MIGDYEGRSNANINQVLESESPLHLDDQIQPVVV